MGRILGPPWFPGFTRAHILWAGGPQAEVAEQKGPRVGAPGPSHPPAASSTQHKTWTIRKDDPAADQPVHGS